MYFGVELLYFFKLIRIRSLLWSEIQTVAVQSIRISEGNIDQIFIEIKYHFLQFKEFQKYTHPPLKKPIFRWFMFSLQLWTA